MLAQVSTIIQGLAFHRTPAAPGAAEGTTASGGSCEAFHQVVTMLFGRRAREKATFVNTVSRVPRRAARSRTGSALNYRESPGGRSKAGRAATFLAGQARHVLIERRTRHTKIARDRDGADAT
jgi:hypothetical protein